MLNLINGDCLEEMDKLIAQGVKVDAIITDPPYGTTACKWDSIIPFDEMWERLNKLIKPNGAIVLFGSEPFSSALRMSNIKNYKYDWVWDKKLSTGFLNVEIMPLKRHELISVFGLDNMRNMEYNKQMQRRITIRDNKPTGRDISNGDGKSTYGKHHSVGGEYDSRSPTSIIEISNADRNNRVHPTQKPVKLMEYLIKTYTNENETVLDFTAGSFSTGVAAVNTNRNFIGIELDKKYFDIGVKRVDVANKNYQPELF